MVSRSERDEDFYLRALAKMKTTLQNKSKKTIEEGFLIEILEEIVTYRKIILFKQAVLDEPAEEPVQFQKLKTECNWNFINMNNRKSSNVFKIPFKRQFA